MPRRLPRYCTEDVDRHGNVRVYFRKDGRKVRLRGTPWTPEFMAAYDAALAGETVRAKPARRQAPGRGTLAAAIVDYFGWRGFKTLSERTKRVRRRVLEQIAETAGAEPLTAITRQVILKGMDRRADTPEAANDFLKIMRHLFRFALEKDLVRVDPTIGISKLASANPEGWHTWTVEEVRQFEARHPVGTKARLALALLMFTGARRSDAVLLGRQHVRDGWIKFKVQKGSRRQFVEVEIPLLDELRQVIEATPERGDLTFLINEQGRPWASGDSFGNRFRDWCVEAGLPHCSPHGLRKAAATIAAENGASDMALTAIFGWTNQKMAATYTRKANRRKMAGEHMRTVVPDQKGDNSVPLSGVVAKSGTKSPKKTRKNNAD